MKSKIKFTIALVAIAIATVVSTFAVIATVGWVFQLVNRRKDQ